MSLTDIARTALWADPEPQLEWRFPSLQGVRFCSAQQGLTEQASKKGHVALTSALSALSVSFGWPDRAWFF